MTTGRINQVANPSSTRGGVARPGGPSPGSGDTRLRTLGGGFPAELQRSAAARRRGAGPGFPDRRGAGSPRGGSDVVGRLGARVSPGPSLPAAWPSRWCWDARSRRTPLWHTFLRAYSVQRVEPFCLGLDSAADQLPGAGRLTHWASSSLLVGSVR